MSDLIAEQKMRSAHHDFSATVRGIINPVYDFIPISIVSVLDNVEGQIVMFDNRKYDASQIANRLRMAAEFVEAQKDAK